MSQPIQILNAKLLQPRTQGIIHRKRLLPFLAEIPVKPVTIVTAGAGYGKTTIISDTCSNFGLDTVWYRIDNSDKDYLTFLSYLITGIKKYYAQFGSKTIRCINDADVSDQGGQEAILTHFLKEIETHIEKDITIVLDDYHNIQTSLKIKNSLEFILPRLPSVVHLVIISRTAPRLNLSRFRAQRKLFEISEKDIIFNLSETAELYSRCLHFPLGTRNIRILHNKTNGWAAGLILIYNSLKYKDQGDVREFLKNISGTHKDISNYLSENIFDLQSDESKNFLIKTSILSRMNPIFCDQLLNTGNSQDILKSLEENHLFTIPYDEQREWYYYHHLFQDFLRTKAEKEIDKNTLKQYHFHAGRLWEKQGDFEEGLRHYIAAEQFNAACRLLNKVGKDYINQGRIQFIISYIDSIPDYHLKRFPWVLYSKARAIECSGNYIDAISEYKRAYQIFDRNNDAKGAGMSLFALGSMYHQIGDFPQAEKRLKQLLNQSWNHPRVCMHILGSLIFITSHQGEMDIADKYMECGNHLLTQCCDSRIQAWLYFNQGFRFGFTGDFVKALQLGKQALEICDSYKLYLLQSFNYHLISWSCYYLGLFSEGLENAQKGLELVKERGYRDSARAWLLTDSGINASALGRTKKACKDARAGLTIFQKLGTVWGQMWGYHALCDVSMRSGDISKAEEYVRTALDLLKGHTLPLHESFLKVKLATCLLEKKQPDAVPDLLEDAEKKFNRSRLFVSLIHLNYARFYWDRKEKEHAIQHLRSGLEICESGRYDRWIINEKNWIVPLLLECFHKGFMKEYISGLLQQMNENVQTVLSQIGKDNDPRTRKTVVELLGNLEKTAPQDLKVYCFGKFRIIKGEIEIPEKKWNSKKAKMLFKYLIHMNQQGYIEKEILMELLWPDENPDKVTGRLHDALSSLRKTLEPDLLRGVPSSYLLREGSAYRLYLGENGNVDTEDFLNELKQAEQENNPDRRLSHFIKAESYYKGDFLAEDTYVEWCLTQRQKLKENYLSVLENIRHHYEINCDYVKCISYANKYLQYDQYAEHIYQQLMRYYMLTGNKTMITRTFQTCKKKMMEGYDSSVSRETESLYSKLAGQM